MDWVFGIGACFALHRRLFVAWGFKHSDEGGGHVFGFGDVAGVYDYLQHSTTTDKPQVFPVGSM